MVIILGSKNVVRLTNALIIPNVSVKVTRYWILPIYKVEIKYNK